jgi:hypothetical protein
VLTYFWAGREAVVPFTDSGVIPTKGGSVFQLHVTLGTSDERLTRVVVPPEQIVCPVSESLTLGIGFTVTVTTTGSPGQRVGSGPVGVMVYLTVPGTKEPTGNVRTSAIGEVPDPGFAPVTPPVVPLTIQLKLVPVTLETG